MGAPNGNQCIYKIVSPTGKVYIGQTVNYATRLAKYKLLHCKRQRRLYASFLKHGVDAHRFEIIEICEFENLNMRERFWQEHYNVLGESGLNCKLQGTGDQKYSHSEETKRLISLSNIGKKHTIEWRLKQRERKLNTTQETKEKIRLANLGRKLPQTTIDDIRSRMMGNSYTLGVIPVNAKIILNIDNGVFYSSIREAAIAAGLKSTTLNAMLVGQNRNRSNLRYT